jgi:hypothetical protein
MSEVIRFKHSSLVEPSEPQKKKGTVTGTHDRSELESMIQRYLELAATALKEKKADHEEEISA